MKISHTLHFLATIVFFCVILTLITPNTRPKTPSDLSSTATAIASVAENTHQATIIPPRRPTVIHGALRPGDSLTSSLSRLPITATVQDQIITNLRNCIDFRRLRPGDRYTVTLDKTKQLVACSYESSPLDVYNLCRTDDGFRAEKQAVAVECRTERLDGTVTSSLYAAFADQGVDSNLIFAFADIFSSRIDFNTETRAGDSFSLLYEKYYKGGTFIGYGHILSARYQRTDGSTLEGFWYAAKGRSGSFYDQNGNNLGSAFIRSPVPMGRLTSSFTLRRVHPILGVVRPHLGIDLAAPVGTPIMAAADGKVMFMGRKGGFGNQVILIHSNGYRTYYGHLSHFAKGLRQGGRVHQKEIIGYVGATGLATGPHLDYRLSEKGVFENPFDLKFKPKSRIPQKLMAAFRKEVSTEIAFLDQQGGQRLLAVKRLVVAPDQRLALL